jgi:Mg/Co/Ni transporter MgtE
LLKTITDNLNNRHFGNIEDMITLDTELILSSKYNYLATKQVNASAYKSIEEYSASSVKPNSLNVIVNAENKKFYEEIGYDADNLVRDLNLTNASNRFAIIKALRDVDINSLLPLLSKENIANGLKFFKKDTILNYISKLPKSELVKILKEIFPNNEAFLKLMSKDSISKFLGSDKIDKSQINEYLSKLPDYELSKMLEAATGKQTDNMNQSQMLSQLQGLSPDRFSEAMKSLSQDKLVSLANTLIKKDETLLKEFSKDALTKPIAENNKDIIAKGMVALDADILTALVQTLPTELLAQVVTQIDPKQFADVLLKNNTDILSQISM